MSDTESDDQPSTTEPEHAQSASDKVEEEEEAPICRICFSEADEEDLGRLISPCLCKGTAAKVHVACINRWRQTSRSKTAFFQCDQCHYRYRIKRANIAGLAENRYAIASLTFLFFLVVVFINGFVGNWLLKQGQSDSLTNTIFFNSPADNYNSWGYSDSFIPLEAVGHAVEVASKVADGIAKPHSGNGLADKPTGRDSSYRKVASRKVSIRRRLVKNVRRSVSHFVVGVSTTGIGSFLWLLLSLPLWPLHPMRNGLMRSVRSSRDSRGNATPLGSILIVLFVIVGLVKSLQLCYKLTRKTAHVILSRAEESILEVR